MQTELVFIRFHYVVGDQYQAQQAAAATTRDQPDNNFSEDNQYWPAHTGARA